MVKKTTKKYIKGMKHTNQCIWEHNKYTSFGADKSKIGFGVYCAWKDCKKINKKKVGK